MKTVISIVLIGFCCLNPLNAQDSIKAKDNTQKIKIFRVWVSLKSDPYKIKGVLYEVKDSSILVSNSAIKKDYSTGQFEVVDIQISNIEKIRIRRKNSVVNGIWIGALSGFFVGAVIGLTDGDDPPGSLMRYSAESKAMMLGVPLTTAGAGIGGLMGLIKVKILINRSMDNYYKNYTKLRKYSINKN